MQPGKERSVLGQVGKGVWEQALDQQVGLFERGNSAATGKMVRAMVMTSASENLGRALLGVVGGVPGRQVRVGLEEVIAKAEGNEHLVGYTHFESGPFEADEAERGVATSLLRLENDHSQPMTGVM